MDFNKTEFHKQFASHYTKALLCIKSFAPNKLEHLFHLLPQNAKILNIGCGSEIDMAIVEHYGHHQVTSIYKGGDIPTYDLPFASEDFDVVFSSCSLLHVDRMETVTALRSIFRVLKSGGTLFLFASLSRFNQHSANDMPFYLWDQAELLSVLRAIGFKLRETERLATELSESPIGFFELYK